MITQVHNTHIFELAKEIHAERIREAQADHLVAQQERKWAVAWGDVQAWLVNLAARWHVRLRTRSQGLA